MKVFNPKNLICLDYDEIKEGMRIYTPSFSLDDPGYEEHTVKKTSLWRRINSDFGDNWETQVDDPEQANYFDVELTTGFTISPFEAFTDPTECVKYVIKDLEDNVIPFRTKQVLINKNYLKEYTQLKEALKQELADERKT